ncbi:electron transport complex protein RnfA [Eubacterium ruminantium]|uniref:Ion-translocating oxidoreductase complex subunit A n=1 Tax=Eubacterium ruminantium TaxID=42322 RepID=A0A1T4PIY7_9FIRM|nr:MULTISPECIES: RnfABCDGE type electron transport complex subunit A [Eubacterium]MCR5367345.1 RnfABCDGE type electron transport complex subunit A [Eubacterium sp.]SCW60220.1 electron transport complex protein RnfA [Eubacterium ruminantium]SDN11574.1 electron transport complex protein RnfA [Eubacterium ruminantium]SJZ91422.1 electron transport complex protein RnfA [Eubacterium ruminantium]
MNIFLFAVSAALINNVVLVQFQGLCPFIGVSKNTKTAAGMGAAVIFVMTLASTVTSIIYYHVLVPLKIEYLNTIAFILIIAGLVQFVEMFLKKKVRSLYKALGVYLPLITTNCAVLGIAISNVQNKLSIARCILNGMFSAVGFAIAIVILASIREKTEDNDVPEAFKGGPMILLAAGLMALAFSGFSGLL